MYFNSLRILGSGSFGDVFAAQTTPEGKKLGFPDKVAIKVLTNVNDKQLLKNELDILKEIDLPHSVKYYGCYVLDERFYIIMELIRGKDLFDLDVRTLTPDKKLIIAKEIAIGIKEIHDVGIVHRDIKLENIMVSDTWEVKIVDYGLSCDLMRNSESYPCTERKLGTPGYMDHKLILGNLKSMQLADWWAYGQLLGELFTTKLSGLWNEDDDTYRTFSTTEIQMVPKEFQTILFELTNPDNEQWQRPSPDEIIWFLGLCMFHS